MDDFEVTGPPSDVAILTPCPICHEAGLRLTSVEHELAYFGRTLETLVRCGACGFRNADFMVLGEREPVRLSLHVASEDHLFARVVRSHSGTWSIPELGLRAEPTNASEAFVTNVEGLLDRAADVILTAGDFHKEDAERHALAGRLLDRCRAMQEGKERVTIVIEDPLGNSAIVHADTVRTPLTDEEVTALHPGMVLFDKADLGP